MKGSEKGHKITLTGHRSLSEKIWRSNPAIPDLTPLQDLVAQIFPRFSAVFLHMQKELLLIRFRLGLESFP